MTNTALSTIDHLTDFQLYATPEESIEVKVFEKDNNFWLNQKNMAELFDVSTAAINQHLKKIFES